ncbi:hypothetical protein CRV08_00820 [Halarcobacter ebronensis]|uniref:Aminoglycoside phosphotransferase domain-containing protein n=1 Tax=Halarcobacter ebronensis TaxID=1462615 RepID=A0A4Q0YLH9_9BACT|nr:phosphotransferase [Halarcobacter ebronensis]RXJ70139.1 hypothetical protein CRV08_00820 [Halarcobacter ebronensis]
MAVLTKLTLDEINSLIADTNISFNHIFETSTGISDTTYIGVSNSDKYVFKLFENASLRDVKSQIKLLDSIKSLNVPNVLSKDIKLYKNKPFTLFSYIEGSCSYFITLNHLEQITFFLASLHKVEDIKFPKKNIYELSFFNKMLDSLTYCEVKKEIVDKFEKIKVIDLKSSALIHGDLFPDNAKFINGRLSGVYDFTQSCFGNIKFDIAVVIVSWCFNEYSFNNLYFEQIIEKYNNYSNKKIEKDSMKIYLLYACLYYALQRLYKRREDYDEYLKKYEILEKIL